MKRFTATSFADAGDLLAYNRHLWNGGSRADALKYGDNGYGYWGMSTVAGTGPCVALPLSEVAAGCGTSARQPKRLVRVFYGEKSVDCQVRDIAPAGVIDLNPDACKALGLNIPVKIGADFIWL